MERFHQLQQRDFRSKMIKSRKWSLRNKNEWRAKSFRQNRREVKRSGGLKRRPRRKKLAHESESISSLYHVKHARNCIRRTSWSIINFNAERKEKMRNEASWKILLFQHKNLRLINECSTGDSLPIHGLRYIEVQQGYSPTIESEMIVIPMTLPMIFLSCQRSNFSTPRWASWQVVSEITREVYSSGSRPWAKGKPGFLSLSLPALA